MKNESENESSDEEPPPGELDKPIVILYEKRAKKEVKRFNPIEKETILRNDFTILGKNLRIIFQRMPQSDFCTLVYSQDFEYRENSK